MSRIKTDKEKNISFIRTKSRAPVYSVVRGIERNFVNLLSYYPSRISELNPHTTDNAYWSTELDQTRFSSCTVEIAYEVGY